ncbi:hypothetical protein JCM1393_25430 [Clostridium carnis]
MSVSVKIELNNANINRLIESHRKALEMTGDAVLSDIKTSAVVPKDTSTLEDSGFVDTTGINLGYTRLIFDTPYARRLYWHPEYNFRTDKNINAQGKWMDSYLYGDNKQFVIDAYAKNLKTISKGLIK